MKKGQKVVEKAQVKAATESFLIDKSRLPDLVLLIQEIAKLDVKDKEQQKKCITLLFRISWLVSELPRPLKFNTESPISAIGARNWVMLDYLSIALKNSQTGACRPWTVDQYLRVIANLTAMNQYFERFLDGVELGGVDTEYVGLDSAVGHPLNDHCLALAHGAIQIALDFTGKQEQDDLTLFRTMCIVGETAKIISPALRKKIIGILGEDSKILTHLTSLRDLIIHDKYSCIETLKSDSVIREKIYKVVLPFLRSIFGDANLGLAQKSHNSEEAIAGLAKFIEQIKNYEIALKAKESNPPDPLHLDLFAKLLGWAVSFIDQCKSLEEFVDRIIANRTRAMLPELAVLTDDAIRMFFLWKRKRLISFYTVKDILCTLNRVNHGISQAEKKRRLEEYFKKADVTIDDKNECTAIIDDLGLLSESSRECIKLLVKGKKIGTTTEDNKFEARRKLINKGPKLRDKSPWQDYLEYCDLITGEEYKACVGKRGNTTSIIDHKLYIECFPQSAYALVESIIASASDLAAGELLALIIFSENLRILDQALDDNEYRAIVYHFMFRQAIPADRMDHVYGEIRRVSQVPGLEGTKEKLVLSRALATYAKGDPPILLSNKERKIVGQLLDPMNFDNDIISDAQILVLQKSLASKHIKDEEVLKELSSNLRGCNKGACLKVIQEAIISCKVISQLESDAPWENRDKKANALYVELLGRVRFSEGKSVKDMYGPELMRLFRSETEASCGLVMEPLFAKCDSLAGAFLAYHHEKDTAKKSKLRLVAEYLVEDMGETAEALATHSKFSDSALYEVSKRNLLIIAFVRKCIAHFPLSVNSQWFEYLLMLFSFGVPERLNQYLKLTEADLWKRVFQVSRRVNISEFRENEELHLDFQMLVEQCGYNPIVRILNEPIGVMGDLNVVVAANSTNTASLWDLFELEIMLGHLINANVRVESQESIFIRSKERVLEKDLRRLPSAELLPELIMKDTVRSLLKDGNFSALGVVGRSDLRMMEILLELLRLMTMNNEITSALLVEIINDENKIRDIILRFFERIKEQSDWGSLDRWRAIVVNYIIMPSILGYRPVDVRMVRTRLDAPAILFNAEFSGFSQLPHMDFEEVPLPYRHCYIYNPTGPFYRRIDLIFANLHNTLRSHDIKSAYLTNIVDSLCSFIGKVKPKILDLVRDIGNIEAVTTVDRVRDQEYLREHYNSIKIARANRLRIRRDVRAVVRKQAEEVGIKLLALVLNLSAKIAKVQWDKIKELLLIWVENNAHLDAYFIEHEYELTHVYQSMDEGERVNYGMMISSSKLFAEQFDEHHVTSKYSFRSLARLSGRFKFPEALKVSLQKEVAMSRGLSRDSALVTCYLKLRAVFNNFSRLSLVKVLFDISPINVISEELEALFQDQYCDETELPLVLHARSGPINFDGLQSNVEHIAYLQNIDLLLQLRRTGDGTKLPLLGRIFQADLSVCELLTDKPSPLIRSIPVQLPPIFNGIVGYTSELDWVLGQLHNAIASRLILRMPTSCPTRVDLVESLLTHFDCPQEFRSQSHSTMAFYEWSTSTIEDLYVRYKWTDERISEFKRELGYRGYERCIQEYYEYRKHYDVIKSYQARAAHYARKMKALNAAINYQRSLAFDAGINSKILYLQENFHQFKRAFQMNRLETKERIKTLMQTNFVKRRMLKCIQLPVIIEPAIDEIMGCAGDKNEFATHKILQLLSAIRTQIDLEIREETHFSIDKEREFELWLDSLRERPLSPRSPQVQHTSRHRFNFLPQHDSSDTTLVPAGSLDYSEGPALSK